MLFAPLSVTPPEPSWCAVHSTPSRLFSARLARWPAAIWIRVETVQAVWRKRVELFIELLGLKRSEGTFYGENGGPKNESSVSESKWPTYYYNTKLHLFCHYYFTAEVNVSKDSENYCSIFIPLCKLYVYLGEIYTINDHKTTGNHVKADSFSGSKWV